MQRLSCFCTGFRPAKALVYQSPQGEGRELVGAGLNLLESAPARAAEGADQNIS